MKLTQYAKKQGITYKTALKWFHNSQIPNSRQLNTGSIIVEDYDIIKPSTESKTYIYCRVSNHSRKNELEYQVQRCVDFCIANGWSIDKIYKEIASGMNDNRQKLWQMIDGKPSKIIIENKDRLTRFGFLYLERLLNKINCEIIVINKDEENENDLMKDFISIITSFCCRLYGLKRGYNKANKLKKELNKDDKN